MSSTTTPPGIFQRLRAAFSGQAFSPAQQMGTRMPDLERWSMPHRSVDMRDWEVAKNMATNVLRPDRTKLLDLYDSILVDSHLASTMESRVLRVVRSRFRLMKNGQPQADLLPLLETQWFEDFLQYAAEAAFRGHTLIELGELAKPGELKSVTRIDPRNVLPWSGVVVRRQGEETGYPFREPPLNAYLIEVGRAEDLGLLCDVGPVAIVKKYAVGSWSDYVHKYGIPPRWVKTNSRDARRFKQLEAMMQEMISSAYGVIEGDEEIQVMQTPGTDAFRVFDELIKRMNSEISKRLLGQDGTSDNKDASGTYGSLKVLQGVAEDRHKADKASVGYVINNELLPRLAALGYPFQGVRFEWDEMQDMAPMELVDAVAKLGMVFDIDPKHVEERTGIKILGPRRMPGEMGGWPPEGGNPPGNGRQGGNKPDKPEEEVDDDDEDGDGITAQWGGEAHTCGICGGGGMIEASAVPPVPIEAVESLLRSAYDGAEFDPAYFDAIADLYVAELNRTWNPVTLNVGFDAPEHVAHALMESNLFHFSGLKTLAAALDLNKLAKDGGTFADFKRRVEESGLLKEYNENHLRAEYTNVAMSGLQAGRYYQMQQTADVLPFGEYVTIGDGRVRQTHADLNGKTWPLGHKAWEHIWPPNGWNCRCTVLPTEAGASGKKADAQWEWAEAKLKERGEWKRMVRGGFNGNRAQSGSIFDLNKAYRTKLGAAAGLQKAYTMNPENVYGHSGMDVGTILGRPNLPAITPELTGEQDYTRWYERMAGIQHDSSGRAVFNDYRGRPWTLEKSTLDKHTGKQDNKDYTSEKRWEYLHLLPNVLNTPDEVWVRETPTGSRWHFIQYQQGRAVVVRAEVSKDPDLRGLKVTSWYALDERKAPRLRNGILIKKMMPA